MIDLSDKDDIQRHLLSLSKDGRDDRIIHIGNNDAVLQQNAEERKDDGFINIPFFGKIRRVAHIDMGTVHLLAHKHDADAISYLENNDTQARDRLIRNYP